MKKKCPVCNGKLRVNLTNNILECNKCNYKNSKKVIFIIPDYQQLK
jgi:ribosomal protein L37AE/L43A